MKHASRLVGILTAAAITISGSPAPQPPTPTIDITIPTVEPVLPHTTILGRTVAFDDFKHETTYMPTGEALLTNEELHADMDWMTYDNIPEPYREQIFSNFQHDYADVMQDTTVDEATYRNLPTPVRNANLLSRIQGDVKHTDLAATYGGAEQLTRVLGATIMTESFFEQDAVNPKDAPIEEQDLGYAQASHHARAYLHEHQGFPHPTDSRWFHSETQIDFITTWYEILHDEAPSPRIARTAYNTGVDAAERNYRYAQRYRKTWQNRYLDYFDHPTSRTQQWVLEHAGIAQEK